MFYSNVHLHCQSASPSIEGRAAAHALVATTSDAASTRFFPRRFAA